MSVLNVVVSDIAETGTYIGVPTRKKELMNNTRILILTNNDAGLYEFRKEVITAIINSGYEVHISVPDTGYIDKLAELGAVMHPTPLDRRGMNPLTDLKLYKSYKALLRDITPDAVLTYTIKPNVYGGVACRRTHIPCLNNVTGLGSSLQGRGPVQFLVKTMYKAGLQGAACVFFQNQYNLEFMRNNGCIRRGQRTRLLAGSGVNLEEHSYQPYPVDNNSNNENGRSVHILTVGRIMDDKGSSEVLNAAERIHAEYPEVVFDIVGSFEEETKEKYNPWIQRLVEAGAVQYHGYRDDVDTFYGKCHGLLHASYHEGMSNVVLEAAASGRPVLTTNIPGCREIYEDGIGGIAFQPKSSGALYEAVVRFLQMPVADRENMGKCAREFVSRTFDRKLVIEAYLEEIQVALNGHN